MNRPCRLDRVKSEPRKTKEKANTFRHLLDDLRQTVAEATSRMQRTQRLVEIAERGVDESKPVTTQIDDLLSANHEMSFSAAEIIEIVHGSSENVRRALVRLQDRGRIERYEDENGAGWYRIDRWHRAKRRRQEGLDE